MTDNTTTAAEAVRDAQQLAQSTPADIRDRTSSDHISPDHPSPDRTSPDHTTADKATTDVVAPRQVFPLPRELRDIIYSHLLDADQVVAPCSRDVRVARAAATGQPVETHPRDVSLAHTYEFHTNILSVNKTINEEAKKVFRKNNFVLIDVWWPNISSTLHELDVPIICEDNAKSLIALRYASLVFTLTHPHPMEGDPTNRMVLAGRDFDIFRRAIRWTFKRLKTTVELTISGNDNPGQTFTILMGGDSPQIIKTGILITDKDFLTKHAKIFIPEIKTMSVPGQEVKVFFGNPQGFNQAASQFMEKDMSCKTFDVEIFITDCLQGTMLVRKAADEMASKGIWGQKLAVARYTNIIRAWRKWDFFRACMQNPLLVGAAKVPLFILLQLLSDIASNAAELHMRCYGLQGSDFLYAAQISIGEYVQVLIDCPHGPAVNHAFGLASHLPMLEHATETTIRLAKVTLEGARSSSDDEAADSHQRISHDITVLDRILHDQPTLEKCVRGDLEAMQSLSCSHFPARVCDSGLLEKYGSLLEETWLHETVSEARRCPGLAAWESLTALRLEGHNIAEDVKGGHNRLGRMVAHDVASLRTFAVYYGRRGTVEEVDWKNASYS